MIVALHDTLRRGGPDNGFLRGAKYLGKDTVEGTLHDFDSFAGLRLGTGGSVVVDLYDIPDGVIERVNKLQGYYPDDVDQCIVFPKVVLTQEGCCSVTTFEYRFHVPPETLIPSGDWIKYVTAKDSNSTTELPEDSGIPF